MAYFCEKMHVIFQTKIESKIPISTFFSSNQTACFPLLIIIIKYCRLFLEDGTMKLADFGLARMYGTPKKRLSPEAITLWYKPPELLLGAYEYSSAADMWSVGCIFAQLLLRRPFLQGKNSDISQLDTIFTGTYVVCIKREYI